MAGVPLPNPRDLLPPLLACLPTAFVSPQPPPALLPLLSPILRQRIQYSASTTGADGWLGLLSWNQERASKLGKIVEGLQIEAHPVSGELELEDVDDIRFRRLDEETMQAGMKVEQFHLMPIYVWCETDTQAGGGSPGWKLSELRALEDGEDGTPWHTTLDEAGKALSNNTQAPTSQANDSNDNDDDDDSYWAAYDQTPAQTPGPPKTPSQQPHPSMPSQSAEDAYYAQYAHVQPALDAHDPDEASAALQSNSTLRGNTLLTSPPDDDPPAQRSLYPADKPSHPEPIAPRPLSPASTSSSQSVARLEHSARTSADLARAQDGARDFISREVRNLFRLARSAGIERDEFEACVRRELDVVAVLEHEL